MIINILHHCEVEGLFLFYFDSVPSVDHFLKDLKYITNIKLVFQKIKPSDPSAIINKSNEPSSTKNIGNT